MILYSYTVCETVRPDGVGVYLTRGELVSVGDQRYVRLPHAGTMLRAGEEWTPCRHAAKRRAAEQVQQLADALAAQAGRLRSEADLEEAAEEKSNALA